MTAMYPEVMKKAPKYIVYLHTPVNIFICPLIQKAEIYYKVIGYIEFPSMSQKGKRKLHQVFQPKERADSVMSIIKRFWRYKDFT